MGADTGEKSLEKRVVVSLLRSFARQIHALEEEEFSRLVKGDWRIEIGHGKSSRHRRAIARCSAAELQRLRSALASTASRESARELIEGVVHSREDLTELAKALDIPAPKRSSTEDLKERLIEATVGFRLRSAAIRGNDRPLDEQRNISTTKP